MVTGVFFLIEKFPVKDRVRIPEAVVVIPEGKTVVEIDGLLKAKGILKEGESLLSIDEPLEGYLFPDTYRFYKDSTAEAVINKFFDNFRKKAEPILSRDLPNFQRNLILASLVEKEVPDLDDRKIVAGLLLKRLKDGMPLQVDASLCYSKLYAPLTGVLASYKGGETALSRQQVDGEKKICYPLTQSDKKIDSLYNTYLNKGLPPAPIANPGAEALQAVMEPKSSPYWYYLSDPASLKTIFSRTLEEHNANKRKYLLGS